MECSSSLTSKVTTTASQERQHHRAPCDDVIEPGLADLRRGQFQAVALVGQGAQKGERASDVVVGHDEQPAALFVDVILRCDALQKVRRT